MATSERYDGCEVGGGSWLSDVVIAERLSVEGMRGGACLLHEQTGQEPNEGSFHPALPEDDEKDEHNQVEGGHNAESHSRAGDR